MKSPFKKKAQSQVQLAPNDPARVPKEHREFINRTFALLKDKELNNFDAQIALQCVSQSTRSAGFLETLKTAVEVGEIYRELCKDDGLLNTDLEVLGMQLTAAMNKMKFGDIEFQEI